MPVPSYQALMLPLLRAVCDGREHTLSRLRESLAAEFGLNAGELSETVPSGGQTLFNNRVGWAKTYLKCAGLVDSSRPGLVTLTSRGKSVLQENPISLDTRYLGRFPEFAAYRARNSIGSSSHTTAPGDSSGIAVVSPDQLSPEETLRQAFDSISAAVADDLLVRVRGCSPAFFERLVVQLLVKMGYGGTEADAARAVGKSGDGGIDGVIREDPLGLDIVYLQAKRWENTVGSAEVRQFAGSLQGYGARKGVFITTSKYSREAKEFAALLPMSKIVLIDGEQLAALMLRYSVGVSAAETYVVKKVDTDFFVED